MDLRISLDDDSDMQQFLDLENRVNGATPYELVAMLYDGALRNVMMAKTYIEQGDTWGREDAVAKAIAIIDEGLVVALNEEVGGEIAQNLKALYDYISVKLLQANLQNSVKPLEEVESLLGHLKVAWDQIADVQAASGAS